MHTPARTGLRVHGYGVLTLSGGYDLRSWPPAGPHREPVTDPDAWAVYVAIGSNVIIARAALWQRFRIEGWAYERFHRAVEQLRNFGVIDVVMSIQRHRPTYERLELPLKD